MSHRAVLIPVISINANYVANRPSQNPVTNTVGNLRFCSFTWHACVICTRRIGVAVRKKIHCSQWGTRHFFPLKQYGGGLWLRSLTSWMVMADASQVTSVWLDMSKCANGDVSVMAHSELQYAHLYLTNISASAFTDPNSRAHNTLPKKHRLNRPEQTQHRC